MSSSITPSIPSATTTTTEPFSGRSLTPLEPQHAIPSYLTSQRRGSITDPSLHLSVPNPELARKYSQPDVNFQNSNSSERRGSFVDNFPPSSSSFSRPSSIKSEQSFSPMETRKLRDALPSISAGASPIKDGFPGPLMNPAFQAQIQQRRHSIAVGETFSPLKRKPSLNTPANPIHPLSPEEYPGKRRESYSDPNIQRLSLYDRRNSYSAPSSPPAPSQNSLASQSSSLPKLNINEVDTSLQEHVDACGINQYGDIVISDLHTSSNIASSHINGGGGEHGESSLTFSPFNPRVSQLVQDEISSTPVLTRRASMPVMTFPSRFNDTVGPQDPSSIPMDVDRYQTPYSRSPELRISHKLAERKRRKEMKELFDELRDSLPVDKSLKTSKWEILSKAVDFINTLKQNQEEISKEVESLRQELAALKGGSDLNTNASTS
ncbi:8586_t:CDS:2 [Ambispora gerdemannii]|uniref:8586_t:CDS:1 n=1 Tax=Ambispora gerdemannii TaxID=144530 RepID=A0A9N8ZMF8_9GLOM|nr:8586_t:CDS:2 [Ambispora gerdemannii]